MVSTFELRDGLTGYWPVHSGFKWYEIDALSTGPFAPPFARSLAPLAHSLTLELMGKWFLSMKWTRQFLTVSAHCAVDPQTLWDRFTIRELIEKIEWMMNLRFAHQLVRCSSSSSRFVLNEILIKKRKQGKKSFFLDGAFTEAKLSAGTKYVWSAL